MKEIEELIDGMEEELKEIRRYFHSHPELSNQEFATADRICEYLDRWGVEYERSYSMQGVLIIHCYIMFPNCGTPYISTFTYK